MKHSHFAALAGACLALAATGGAQAQRLAPAHGGNAPRLTTPDPAVSSSLLTSYVNPLLGTSPTLTGGDVARPFPFNTGNVFPGADTPQGMVQFSPDTPSNQAGGYWYPDSSIKAFSLTHFSGRGIPYECDFGFMPVAGAIGPSSSFNFGAYTSAFSHANESASPGYYQVVLNTGGGNANGPKVELTGTTRTGMMQATFPPGTATGSLLINFANNVRGVSNAQVNLVNGTELTGFATSTTSGGQSYKVYVSMVFDQPIASAGLWNGADLTSAALTGTATVSGANAGAVVSFNTAANTVIHATAGVSYVSIANAQLNRTTENPAGTSFAAVQQAAGTAWNNRLGVIKIDDPAASADNLTVFYTELYRTMLQPNIFEDVNGQYIGFDNAVHTVASGHHFYTHIEGWGGYRSAAPFGAFFMSNEYSDIAQSLVLDSATLGAVPRWVQMNSDSHGNVGDGGSIILAQAYAFGATNFDTGTALTYMRANAAGSNGYREYGSNFVSPGWVPNDFGMSLEYCAADLALAEFANSLGQANVYNQYLAAAQSWRNLFNSQALALQARDTAGNWNPPGAASYEGSPTQLTWMLPFNLRGLFDDMGGNAGVVARLDTYFGWNAAQNMYTALNTGYGGTAGSGFGGDSPHNYAGDQTCEMHPWMYLYAGAPWKTQKVVRDIETTLYLNTPGGMPGNDDGGELASWYVFAALGLYPEAPGVGGFVLGSPLFASATVTLENGSILQLNGANAAPANPYVQSLTVNGAPSSSLWLPVSTVLSNPTTTLAFTLGATPNTSWGSAAGDAPPSFDVPGTTPAIVIAASAAPNPVTGTSTTLSVLGADPGPGGAAGLTYTWSTLAAPANVQTPAFGGANGTNGGQNTSATFFGVGSYAFQVAISNGARVIYGNVNVTVNQTAGLAITPAAASTAPGGTQQFTAAVTDQFGNVLSSPAVTWSVASGAGSIGSSSGLFQAANTVGSTTIRAAGGGYTATAAIDVNNPVDVTSGLVGRWTFDEGAGTVAANTSPDSTVGSGALVHGPAWTAPGYVGAACLGFTPSALTYVNIPSTADLNVTAAITLSVWIKPAGWNGNSRIMEKGGDPAGTPGGADPQYTLLSSGSTALNLTLGGVGTVSAAMPGTGAWHHVAATWDGATMKIYIDNVLAGSQAATGAIGTTTLPLIIGNKSTVSTNTANVFNGSIDDARVYNRALSASEVTTVYNDASATPWIVSPAASSPAAFPLGANSTLSVLGGDVYGESLLTYTWQTTGNPPAPVSFSPNGANAAKRTAPSFSQTGTYNLLVTAADPQNRTVTSSVTVAVQTPYAAWQTGVFSSSERQDPAISGDLAAPAGDGIPNLLKYALHLNPHANGSAGLPVGTMVTSAGTDHLALTYTQVLAATDITYTVQVSSDLQTWHSGPAYTTITDSTVSPGGLTKTVTAETRAPMAGNNPPQFIRLKISKL